MSQDTPKTAEHLELEFEAKLLRQEHRLFSVIYNYWTRKKFSEDDPRRDAIIHAIAWRMVVAIAPTAAAASVGFGGLFALIFAWEANELLKTQNQYFKDQNVHFEEQNRQIRAQFTSAERTKLIDILYRESESNDRPVTSQYERFPAANVRARSDALHAFVAIERLEAREPIDLSRALLTGITSNEIDLSGANLNCAMINDAVLVRSDLTRCNLAGADLTHCNLTGADLSEAELYRALLFGAELNNADLTRVDVNSTHNFSNREKERIEDSLIRISRNFELMVGHPPDANLERCTLISANLSKAKLNYTNLNSAILRNSNLSNATLCRSSLLYADLSGAILSNANLSGSLMGNTNLTGTKLFGTNLTGADLRGAIVDNENWIEEILRLEEPPEWPNSDEWQVVKSVTPEGDTEYCLQRRDEDGQ